MGDIEEICQKTTIQDLINKRKYIYKKIDMKKLDQYIKFIIKDNPTNPDEFIASCKLAKRAVRLQPSKVMMVHRYRELSEKGEVKASEELDNLMIKKIVRKASGVQVITVLTSPYPSFNVVDKKTNTITRRTQKFSCGQNCAYCPLEETLILECVVLKVTEEKNCFKIDLHSNDPIDEVRVLTYMTTFKPTKDYVPAENRIDITGNYNYNIESRNFTIKIIKKFGHYFKEGGIFYGTKIEQPRSYLSTEPAVMRANQNNFDPVLQFFDRGVSLEICGNHLDKIELLVLGGTWSHYPTPYQIEFIRDLYYAANIFETGVERERLSLEGEIHLNEKAKCRIIGLTLETRPDCITKREILKFRRYGCTRVQLGVQHINDEILEKINRGCYMRDTERAIFLLKHNGFKVDIHLMPDLPFSSYEEDTRMFGHILGVKKITHTIMNKRLIKDPRMEFIPILIGLYIFWDFWIFLIPLTLYLAYRIVMLTKQYNIIEKEKIGIEDLWYEYPYIKYDLICPTVQADQWKIYPTEVVRWTQIEKWYHEGTFIPYAEEINPETGRKKIIDLLINAKSQVFPWIRLNRVIRDIPNDEIIAGNQNISLRDSLKGMMKEDGLSCDCIRCREIRNKKFNPNDVQLIVRSYREKYAQEFFISYESKNFETIYGFCRLRLNTNNDDVFFPSLRNSAIIRELHVYGLMVPHYSKKKKTQHFGFGTRLLNIAEKIAKNNKYEKIAVISGVGVRQYYGKRGYHLSKSTYMEKKVE